MKKIKIILSVIILLAGFIFVNQLVRPKYATDLVEGSMVKEYYGSIKNHEVIVIGDCEVYSSYDPVVLFEKYGITSYLRGSPQQLIWQSYYLLKETLKYETPKVVIFNVNSMRHSEPVSEEYNHLTIDYMKLSKEKIDIINASMMDNENILYYLIPLLRYHNRIYDLNKEDFQYLFKSNQITINGFLINTEIKPVNGLPAKKPLANYSFSESNYDYLKKMSQLCKNNGVKLVLVKAPSLYPYWYDEYDQQIEKFAQENNLDFYNFLDYIDEIGLDYNLDTYDAGLHVNYSGAVKLSEFFGKMLSEKYNLTDYRNNTEIKEQYDKIKEKYEEMLRGN